MKWEDDVIKTKDESEPKLNNKCTLVWEVITIFYFIYSLIFFNNHYKIFMTVLMDAYGKRSTRIFGPLSFLFTIK